MALARSSSVGSVGPPGQQLERHEQQQQTAGRLQRRQLDAEVAQDRPAEESEDDDHSERDDRRLPGQLVPLAIRTVGGHRDEDRHDAWRVGDDKERDEDFPEELDVRDQRRHPVITAVPVALREQGVQVVLSCRFAADPVAGQLAVIVAASGRGETEPAGDSQKLVPLRRIMIGMCDLDTVEAGAAPARR